MVLSSSTEKKKITESKIRETFQVHRTREARGYDVICTSFYTNSNLRFAGILFYF